jgi:hypothetical protein
MYKGDLLDYCNCLVFHYKLHRAVFEKLMVAQLSRNSLHIIQPEYSLPWWKEVITRPCLKQIKSGHIVFMIHINISIPYTPRHTWCAYVRCHEHILRNGATAVWILNLITRQTGVISFTPGRFISQYSLDRRMGRSASASIMFFSRIKPKWWVQSLRCTFHCSELRRHICLQKLQYFIIFIRTV